MKSKRFWPTAWSIALPILVLGAGVAIAMIMIDAKKPVPASDRPDPLRGVDCVTVERGEVINEVVVYGTVQPRSETTLVAEVTGRILTVDPSFFDGGFFTATTELLTIDSSIYLANVATAEAELARADAVQSREEAEAAIAKREWDQFGKGDANPLVLREPQKKEAVAGVKSAQARLDRAKVDLKRTTVTAPYPGRVRKRLVNEGQYVVAGTPVATVYATDYAEVRLPISLEELVYLNLPLRDQWTDPETAPKLTLEVQIGPRTEEWSAYLHRTEGELDPKTRVLYAVARIEMPYQFSPESNRTPLLVGQFVCARLKGTRFDAAATLPRSALRKDDTVWVVDEKDQLELRKVEVLRVGRNEIQVGGGIETGDRVVTSRLDFAVKKMVVRVRAAEEGGE